MVTTDAAENTIPTEQTEEETQTNSNDETPPPKSQIFVYSEELDKEIPYSRQHLRRMEAAGLFPKRVRLGPNRIAWVRSEIHDWIEARKEER